MSLAAFPPAIAAPPTPTASTNMRVASPRTITLLLTSFAGLGLPRTLSLPVDASTSISDVIQAILSRLPRVEHRLIITTTSNKQLLLSSNAPISTLLSTQHDTFLPLRLSARLCGGKGGFGSQLRAAGGRMSSRKNRQNAQHNPNGSNRNLDGRRLRTVDEAKRLAEYLAIKPEMERKEKEERRKRWEAVVEAAERKEEEIKSGKAGRGQGRLDAEFVEGKEVAEEKTREAVLRAMREGLLGAAAARTGSETEGDDAEGGSGEEDEAESSGSSGDAGVEEQTGARTFFGWDEDDEDDEEDDDDDQDGDNNVQPMPVDAHTGKGKAKIA